MVRILQFCSILRTVSGHLKSRYRFTNKEIQEEKDRDYVTLSTQRDIKIFQFYSDVRWISGK